MTISVLLQASSIALALAIGGGVLVLAIITPPKGTKR
jgi:hypothetical protein